MSSRIKRNILLFTLAFLLIICQSVLVSSFDFDNVKEFDPEVPKYGQIEVINLYGLGETLAVYTLLENTDVCFTNCYSIGHVTLYEDGKLFDEMNFYDPSQVEDREVKNFKMYIKEYYNEVIPVEIKDINCNGYLQNGSSICETNYYYQNKIIEKFKWVNYNYEILEPGEYDWKIEAEKNYYESVDWVASAFGNDLSEWADWNKTDALNRNCFNIQPQVTDANQQLELDLGYPINKSGVYVVRNDTNLELSWATINNSVYNTKFWTNTSVTSGSDFGICVYYNSSENTQKYNLSAVMLEAFEFESQAEVDAYGDVAEAGTWTANVANYVRGMSSMAVGCAGECYKTEDFNIDYSNATLILNLKHSLNANQGDFFNFYDDATTRYGFGMETGTSSTNWATDCGGWADSGVAITSAWTNIKIDINGSGYSSSANGVQVSTCATDFEIDRMRIYLANKLGNNNYYDSFFFYKNYFNYNPTVTVGVEEGNVFTIVATIIPANATYDSELNCSAVTSGLTGEINFSWFKNNDPVTTYDNTVAISGDGTYYTSKLVNETLVKGDEWICNVKNVAQESNSTAITIQNSKPTIPTYTYPDNINFYNGTIIMNCSGSSDPDVDTINYEFVLMNSSGNILLQNQSLTTYIFNAYDNATFIWKCRANDNSSVSNYTSNNSFYVNTKLINNVTVSYTSPVNPGIVNVWNLTVNYNNGTVSNVSVIANYNGTTKASISTANNEHWYNYVYNPVSPILNDTQNVTFSFNVSFTTLSNSQFSEIYYYSHQVINLSMIFNCTTATNQFIILNFTFYNEETTSAAVGNFSSTFIVWKDDKKVNKTYNFEADSVNKFSICISNNQTYITDMISVYGGSNYKTREYYLNNYTINPLSSALVDLYEIEDGLGTYIDIYTYDQQDSALPNLYVYAERYDVSTNTYKLVAVTKTDDVGHGVIPLKQTTGIYRFLVKSYPNTVIFTSDPRKITTTDLILRVSGATFASLLDKFGAISYDLTYNPNTTTFRAEYTTDGTSVYGCLSVYKMTLQGQDQVCYSCQQSASAVLLCTIDNSSGQYFASLTANINPTSLIDSITIAVSDTGDYLNQKLGYGNSLLVALIIIGTMALCCTWSPSVSILLGIVGFIFCIGLELLTIKSGVLVLVAIAGIYFIARVKS